MKKEWKRYKKTKYIKVIDSKQMLSILQNWIIDKSQTNAGLISISLHYHCRKFIKELEKIPLSEELQGYFK